MPSFYWKAHGPYAAIAFSPTTGLCGYSHGQANVREAQLLAFKNCDAPDARIVVWVKNSYCALAAGDKNAFGTGWISGDQAASGDAEQRALEECGKRTTNGRLITCIGPAGIVEK